MTTEDQNENRETSSKYRAPALEKGLEILELLVSENKPITLTGISERLGRSRNEIFRMVHELEAKGYIQRNPDTEGYSMTAKLFALGLKHPPNKTLLEVALPHMRNFSNLSEQSCHIAVAVDDQIFVICRVQAPGPVSFSVSIGHKQPLSDSTSGTVLLSWQSQDYRDYWLDHFEQNDELPGKKKLLQQIAKAQEQGFVREDSRFVKGVTDIAAPIMRGGVAVASLTAPCLTRLGPDQPSGLPVELLKSTAEIISSELPQT